MKYHILEQKAMSGSNWTPKFDHTDTSDHSMYITDWKPSGSWSIRFQYVHSKLGTSLSKTMPLMLFYSKDQEKQANAKCILMTIAEGSIPNTAPTKTGYEIKLWNDVPLNPPDSQTSVDTVLQGKSYFVKISAESKKDFTSEIEVEYNYKTSMITLKVNGKTISRQHEYMFSPNSFDNIMIGRWVRLKDGTQSSAAKVDNCEGLIDEIALEDYNDPRNSRLYDLIIHSPNSTIPGPIPDHFVNHLDPENTKEYLWWAKKETAPGTGGGPLDKNWWQEVKDGVVHISGPDEITGPGYYVYHLEPGFTTEQEVTWNTNGTHFNYWGTHGFKKDDKWYYLIYFLVEEGKYLDTRLHINATVKNGAFASKTIADKYEAAPSPITLMPHFSSVPSNTQTIKVKKNDFATSKLTIDPFTGSNYKKEDVYVEVHVNSSDFQKYKVYTSPKKDGTILEKIEIPYSDIIESLHILGNSTEVNVCMHVTPHHDYYGGKTLEKKYFFDKTEIVEATPPEEDVFPPPEVTNNTWDDSAEWDDTDIWNEAEEEEDAAADFMFDDGYGWGGYKKQDNKPMTAWEQTVGALIYE